MSRTRLLAAAASFLLVSGCVIDGPVVESVYSPCHALGSSGWSAHVERIPDHHNRPVLQPILFVQGEVTVPSDGYEVSLDLGPVQRLDRNVQQVIVRTTPPADAAPAAPAAPRTAGGATGTKLSVEGRFPAPRHIGEIAMRCGDGILATIGPIPGEDEGRRRSKRFRIF